MAGQSELLTDAILEDKIADIWLDYPYLYKVRSPNFKNRPFKKSLKSCNKQVRFKGQDMNT